MMFHVLPGSSGFYRSIFQHVPIIEPSIGRGRFSKLQMSSSRGQSHKFNTAWHILNFPWMALSHGPTMSGYWQSCHLP